MSISWYVNMIRQYDAEVHVKGHARLPRGQCLPPCVSKVNGERTRGRPSCTAAPCASVVLPSLPFGVVLCCIVSLPALAPVLATGSLEVASHLHLHLCEYAVTDWTTTAFTNTAAAALPTATAVPIMWCQYVRVYAEKERSCSKRPWAPAPMTSDKMYPLLVQIRYTDTVIMREMAPIGKMAPGCGQRSKK